MSSGSTSQIRVFVRGGPGLADTLMGRLGQPSFADMLGSLGTVGRPEVLFEECSGVASFRGELAADEQGSSDVFTFGPNIVVLSVEADLRRSVGSWGSEEADQFEQDLLAVVALIKDKLASHIMVVNTSSIDPTQLITSYHGLDKEPMELRAHRYNLALQHVSSSEGISVIDADRLIAEMGARDTVSNFLAYQPAGAEAICAELVRVVTDYGFVDNRPLVPQVGRDATN